MRRALVILFCLLSVAALAQLRRTAFFPVIPAGEGGGWVDDYYPTNIPGHPAFGWYVGSNYATNASTATWTDWSGKGWDFTNAAASRAFPQAGALNGRDAVWFNGSSSILISEAITNYGDVMHEFVFVLAVTNNQGAGGYGVLLDGNTTANRNTIYDNALNMTLQGSSQWNDGPWITNTWLVVDFQTATNGTDGIIFTNNIAAGTGNTGENPLYQVRLGSRNLGDHLQNFVVAECVFYATNCPGTNGTYRTNLYNYFKNKYGL